MIVALAALLLQAKEPGPIVVPAGTSHEFQQMAYEIEDAVAAGKWDEAARLGARLPSREVTIEWIEQGLSANQKLFFGHARDQAIKLYLDGMKELKIGLAKPGKIKVSFVPTLPPNADSTGPAGAVYTGSPAEGDPVIESVLALARGESKRPIEELDVRNEVTYAIGAYFGLARQPRPNNLMFRSEESNIADNKLSGPDIRLINTVLDLSDRIRKAVAGKKDPGVAAPQIFIEPAKLTHEPVGQAERMGLSLQVTNRGKGTLQYRVVPDCGCFLIGSYSQTLAPGDTTIVPMYINTLDFVGKLSKHLYVYSNDPEVPIKMVPFEAVVRPAYRFVDKAAFQTLIVDENGGTYEAILVLDDSQSFKIKKISVSGISAIAEYDEKGWEGVLDNPEIGEGPKKRKGYVIRALVAPNLPPGRLTMTLEIETDSDVFKTIYQPINVQRGIVAVPLSAYFGSVGKEAARASVVITRPGKPYKVLKVVSDTDWIVASVEPYRPGTEYKIVATYTGKAPIGTFRGTIKVYTDDPKQPVIDVPFEGTVR